MSELKQKLDGMRAGIRRVAATMPEMPRAEITLARMLMISGDSVTRQFAHNLRPHGLNETEFRTLMVLFSSEEGRAFPTELCLFATQKPTNMTRITDTLVSRNLISREPCAQDRRRIALRITPAGKRFVRQMLPLLFPKVKQLFVGFSRQDKQQLDHLLDKLLSNLAQSLPERTAHT